jgi:hypothetical protein
MRAMGIRDHPITPRSSWQNGYLERVIGSIRRECLDHMIVLSEAHLQRTLDLCHADPSCARQERADLQANQASRQDPRSANSGRSAPSICSNGINGSDTVLTSVPQISDISRDRRITVDRFAQ